MEEKLRIASEKIRQSFNELHYIIHHGESKIHENFYSIFEQVFLANILILRVCINEGSTSKIHYLRHYVVYVFQKKGGGGG